MKINLNIPENLSEITLAQYQKWIKIIDNEELSTFFQQKMIEIFCNADLKDILQMRVHAVDEVTAHIDNIFNEKPKFQATFELDNVEYGFIPKLDENTPQFHKNIRIEDNEFHPFDYPVLYALSVDGISFENNTVTRSQRFEPYHKRKFTFSFEGQVCGFCGNGFDSFDL